MTYPGIANIYANSERGGLILMYKRVMIKISGEALAGETGFGLDFDTIGDIAKTIARCSNEGAEIAMVVGGGNFWRGRSGKSRSYGNARNGYKRTCSRRCA